MRSPEQERVGTLNGGNARLEGLDEDDANLDENLMVDEGDLTLDDDYQRLVTVPMMYLLTVCDVPKSHSRVMYG